MGGSSRYLGVRMADAWIESQNPSTSHTASDTNERFQGKLFILPADHISWLN